VESKEVLTGSKLDLATLPLLPASAASTGLIFFKSRGESWVEVIDANKIVQLRKSLKTGETAAAAGALPLSVVVGRVDTTEVLVRGKSFDLSTISKDNVARFEVK
jgi:cytoskeleton protein RodZ